MGTPPPSVAGMAAKPRDRALDDGEASIVYRAVRSGVLESGRHGAVGEGFSWRSPGKANGCKRYRYASRDDATAADQSDLLMAVRKAAGRAASPSAGVVIGQSVEPRKAAGAMTGLPEGHRARKRRIRGSTPTGCRSRAGGANGLARRPAALRTGHQQMTIPSVTPCRGAPARRRSSAAPSNGGPKILGSRTRGRRCAADHDRVHACADRRGSTAAQGFEVIPRR